MKHYYNRSKLFKAGFYYQKFSLGDNRFYKRPFEFTQTPKARKTKAGIKAVTVTRKKPQHGGSFRDLRRVCQCRSLKCGQMEGVSCILTRIDRIFCAGASGKERHPGENACLLTGRFWFTRTYPLFAGHQVHAFMGTKTAVGQQDQTWILCRRSLTENAIPRTNKAVL